MLAQAIIPAAEQAHELANLICDVIPRMIDPARVHEYNSLFEYCVEGLMAILGNFEGPSGQLVPLIFIGGDVGGLLRDSQAVALMSEIYEVMNVWRKASDNLELARVRAWRLALDLFRMAANVTHPCSPDPTHITGLSSRRNTGPNSQRLQQAGTAKPQLHFHLGASSETRSGWSVKKQQHWQGGSWVHAHQTHTKCVWCYLM